MKPLLLLDVDGVLNPYANSNNQLRKGKLYTMYKIHGFQVWLTKWHGEELKKLTDVFDLVWCTTWEREANTCIGPKIGLPDLPVVRFNENLPTQPPEPGLHWKVAPILEYCSGRPFAWVDDEVGVKDSVYVSQQHNAPFMMRKIDPVVGLVEEDFTAFREWAEGGMYDDPE